MFILNRCCAYCKRTPQTQHQTNKTIHLNKTIDKKDLPYGYVDIYPGVRTSDNGYNCPVLAVHLYRYSEHKSQASQNERTLHVDGKNRQEIQEGPEKLSSNEKSTREEEFITLPVEYIATITSKLETKEGLQKEVHSEIIPHYDDKGNCCDQCCDCITKCCSDIRDTCCCCCQKQTKISPYTENTEIVHHEQSNRTVKVDRETLEPPKQASVTCELCRCWCCRIRKLVGLTKVTTTVAEQEAKRLIIITIKYNKYSNHDAVSSTRFFNLRDQLQHYKEQCEPDEELKFYLMNDTDVNPGNFQLKRKQAELLCRTVMQLKGMKDNYPSDALLDQILDTPYKKRIGDEYPGAGQRRSSKPKN